MSKLRTDLIQGYDSMTAEEKLSALESLDIPDPDYSGYVKKEVFDKTASELAAKKRELNEKLSSDEVKAREEAEKLEKLQKDYEALLREVKLSENKANFLSLGYSETLAEETAAAMTAGDFETVFANQKKHQDAIEKRVREAVLNSTPKPTGGNGENTITQEQFDNMGYADRAKLFETNKELYQQLNGGHE